jgi:hypothetical protein
VRSGGRWWSQGGVAKAENQPTRDLSIECGIFRASLVGLVLLHGRGVFTNDSRSNWTELCSAVHIKLATGQMVQNLSSPVSPVGLYGTYGPYKVTMDLLNCYGLKSEFADAL